MTSRISPGMVVRWRADSERRIANGYSTATRYRVLGIRVVRQDEERPRLLRGERIVIMQLLSHVGRLQSGRVRVHERDVERAVRR